MDRARADLIKKTLKITMLQNSCPEYRGLFWTIMQVMSDKLKVRSETDQDVFTGHLLEGQLVHCIPERPPKRSIFLPFVLWEVTEHHYYCFVKHFLSDGSGASDASCACVSTAPRSTSSRGSSRKRERMQEDDDNDESTSLPLVQSIQELVGCQQQLLNDWDRNHKQRMNQQTQSMSMREQHCERVFCRKDKFTDATRSYRTLNAE